MEPRPLAEAICGRVPDNQNLLEDSNANRAAIVRQVREVLAAQQAENALAGASAQTHFLLLGRHHRRLQ
jgi:hypothetical protein